MRKRSSFVLIAILTTAAAGAVAVHTGGGRLRQWLLALHGLPAGHGTARPRRAPGAPAPVWPETSAGYDCVFLVTREDLLLPR